MTPMDTFDTYFLTFRGSFKGVKSWQDLDTFWASLRKCNDGNWYVYDTEQAPPTAPLSTEEFAQFIPHVDQHLRAQHEEDYCGIVYVDNPGQPTFIKIYDPNNLGVVCGFSNNPPLPGWTLSTIKPVDLKTAIKPPGNRRRWWNKLFNK